MREIQAERRALCFHEVAFAILRLFVGVLLCSSEKTEEILRKYGDVLLTIGVAPIAFYP